MRKKKLLTLIGSICLTLVLTALLIPACAPAAPEKYPTRAITLVCPWGAGGGTDRISRYLADRLGAELGQPVAVVNRTGGHGAVGHSAGALAPPDGYTICMSTFELSTMHHMGWTKISPEDVKGIILINEDPAGVMVHPDDAKAHGWKNVTDWLEYVKDNPGLKASGTGTGGVWQLDLMGMLNAAGMSPTQVDWLPSIGAAEAITWLLGKHIDVTTCSVVEAGPQLDAGTLIALATMSDERLPRFPDVPTLKEQGIDWSAGAWRGITVPVGTPEPVVKILEDAIKKIIDSPEWIDWMNTQGFTMKYLPSDDFDDYMRGQSVMWRDMLKLGGLIE